MLVSLKTVIDMAEKGNFAIPAFNVYNIETVMGVIKAAEEERAPVIIQIYPRLILEEVGYYLCPAIVAAARKATVPVCFHLDHGPSEIAVQRALRWGATGIMYDGSVHPLKENIENTKHIVDICETIDVPVEGELGHIGSVMEGVCMSMKDCLLTLDSLGISHGRKAVVIGGGSRGKLWRQILSHSLDMTLIQKEHSDSSFGSAVLAGITVGIWNSPAEALDKCNETVSETVPNSENVEKYNKLFIKYKKIQKALEPVYNEDI